jgi:hypothetical protein
VRHGLGGYVNRGCRCATCRRAWREWKRASAARRALLSDCEVEGCDRGAYARGMCKPHYERARVGLPLVVPIQERPSARGEQPGKQRAA